MDTQLILTTVSSVAMLLFIALIGFVGGKSSIMDELATKKMSAVTVNILMPMMMIKGYFTPFDSSSFSQMLWCYLGSFISGVLGLVVARLILKKKKNSLYAEEFSAGSFSNCGIVGTAIVAMIIGDSAYLYGSSFLTINSFFMWIGVPLVFAGKFDSKSVKKALFSPVMLGIYVGLVIYFGRINIPAPMQKAITSMGDCVAPLSMLITGAMMARTNIKDILKNKRVYFVTVLKLFIQPLVFLFFICLLPIPKNPGLSCFIDVACPTASSISMLTETYGGNTSHSASITTMTTILCIITIPMMVAVYSIFS